MTRRALYAPQRVIAVDVDGTLLVRGALNLHLVEWLRDRAAEGFELWLWSARGRQHSEQVAALPEAVGLFHRVMSKPGYILDDQGWNWVRYTQVVRGLADFIGAGAGDGPALHDEVIAAEGTTQRGAGSGRPNTMEGGAT